jgi:(p)ppGpp synthase/HD superfamily hydrolase
MRPLERAIVIAVTAHAGQSDKAGRPYILHPLRLMLQMSTEEEQIVAVLHDVIEDSETKLEDISKAGFDPEIVKALDYLTRRSPEEYDAYIQRLSRNRTAVNVKLADLRDNLDPSRLLHPTDRDLARSRKYTRAYEFLSKVSLEMKDPTCNEDVH